MEADDFLGELHAKSYEREIDENESIWRSLPLFTVSFGFAATLLYYLASFVRFELEPWPLFTVILLTLPAAAFGWAFRWFWDVIRIRTHRYVAPDTEIRKYAVELKGFYDIIGGTEKQIERDVLSALKEFYYKELAESASLNQKNNQAKAKARSLVAFWLTAGFALAFFSTALMLGHEKLNRSGIITNDEASMRGAPGKTVEATVRSAASITAPAAIRSGGGRESVPQGEGQMSKNQTPAAPSRPPAQAPSRPAPPEPVYVQKDSPRPPETR